MYKKYLIILLCFFDFLELHPQVPEPSGRRFRTITEDHFSDKSIIIGATTGAWALGRYTGQILDREFNYVTPENDFKQRIIHPDEVTWDWEGSDAWLQHIIDNNQILRIHGPIGPQCSSWAMDDSRTPEELETNMREFLTAVCQRYNGKPGIVSMDVVNETVIKGIWHKDKPGTNWECPWFKIGLDDDKNKTPLYIKYSFEIAQQYAPDLKLIYNHHDFSPASWELIKETIAYLREKGLRVDGIGWQAHVSNGFATADNLNYLRNLIDWAHDNDLEFHITEASVWMLDGISQAALELQAETYQAIIEVLLEKRFTGKVGWNIWHIDDGHGWHIEWYPSLFDSDYSAKPAYYAIQESLENAGSNSAEEYPHLNNSNLHQNHPNPFTSSTTIEYTLTEPAQVIINIFNALGSKVAVMDEGLLDIGKHSSRFESVKLTAGNYYYTIQLGQRVDSGKMLLVR